MTRTTEPQEGIDQVREILVGAIQRDLERRLARAESHFAARLSELQQEARRRTEVIEAHQRQETDALSTRVEHDGLETKESFRALTREHRETTAGLEQRLGKLEESISRAQHELRQQILEQAKSFLDELQALRAEVMETLERELGSLETDTAQEPTASEYDRTEARPSP